MDEATGELDAEKEKKHTKQEGAWRVPFSKRGVVVVALFDTFFFFDFCLRFHFGGGSGCATLQCLLWRSGRGGRHTSQVYICMFVVVSLSPG